MDFNLGEHSEKFREEVRGFLEEHVTDEMIARAHRTGTMHDWDLHRAMAAKGWIAAPWPEEYGGQGRDPWEMAAFHEEAVLAEAPLDGLLITMIVASTLRDLASEELKREVIPAILRGEVLICLGYSEPSAGSDVASVRTSAVRDGDAWIMNGEKVFTSLAHESQYVFLLTRTSSEGPKHDGLTLFLVPMDTPGIEIQAIHTLGGERTNATFYNDVRVEDRWRVGAVGGGWHVLEVALAYERTQSGGVEGSRVLAQFVAWARSARDRQGRARIEDPAVREAIARASIRNEVAQLLGQHANWVAASGRVPGVEGPMAQLYRTVRFQHTCSELLDLLGPEGVLQHGEPGAPVDGWIERAHRHAAVGTIYAGSSEIVRTIIARRGLELPSGTRR